MAAAVVDETAMIARKIRDLLIPIFKTVDLSVDENEVTTFAVMLVIEFAAVD
jgi:hypothetical protein